MRVIEGTGAIEKPLRRPVLTVGNFDGVHVGHRSILDTVVRRARDVDGEAAAYTFEPHPRKLLRPDTAPRLLTTLEQKLELFEAAGLDIVIVEPFTLEFAKISAERFIRERILGKVNPVEVYVGYDFHFGRDREGSMRLLTELGPRLGFSVTIIPEVRVGDRDVNSTRIRELLTQSRIEEAADMLARAYAVRGTVIEGERRGRTLGFPTANLDPESEVLPASGVYAGWLRLLDPGQPERGSRFAAVTNVGTRATFEEKGEVLAEAHLLDFDGDLYGRRVELSFELHLRAERRFPGVEELRRQIAADAREARRRLLAG